MLKARLLQAGAIMAVCTLIEPARPVLAADPPPLNGDAPAATVAASGVDAQKLCAAPATELQRALARALKVHAVTANHRRAFLRQLDSCREVYLLEMQRLEADFADLPAGSICHSAQRDLHEGLDIFDAIEARARALPLRSAEDLQAAGTFFNLTSPGLVRAVNGLYLLRHAVCLEERSAPFPASLTDSEISPLNLPLD